ncbi:MAG: 16S rRNA (uracil(1498)-N(3))-methyltransferase [Omnitrophica bacterium]|nr:16S rRNA (uracil(1498)-N(3))-methyltransferase [Candidatus Omnitrophota bacterium]
MDRDMCKARVYIEPAQINDNISLGDKDIIHKLKDVLRLKKGERVLIFDGAGKEYSYTIANLDKKKALFNKCKVLMDEKPPNKKVILGFPVARESKINFILQKGTELGVYEFIPFLCQRSLSAKPSQKKIQRWSKIVIEATRQSQRLWVPRVNSILDFAEIAVLKYKTKLAASIAGKSIPEKISEGYNEILFVVGPEGDFSPEEYSDLKKNGFNFISLSSNILRVETAAIFGSGLLKYFLDGR